MTGETKTSRWTGGVSRLDGISKESGCVTNIAGKIKGNRLRWFGYVQRRNNDVRDKKIGEIEVE